MKLLIYILFVLSCISCLDTSKESSYILSQQGLKDKIKGGWAGQVIGVTYGGPTEFKYNGTIINDYESIPWSKNECKWWYENCPGLYDDIYMDITFVDIFEKHGFDVPADVHAKAFAYAEYPLWHANQVARYNIRNGLMPPASGHWLNNPHADDIDFQIEADFIGLMTPGMVNQGAELSDKIGHIMTYGDGFYGGAYVAAMYSLSFIHNDVYEVVTKALEVIPKQSTFHQCISDVITWHKQYPNDWKQCWFEVQKKWASESGCPEGVFSSFNIDAKVNCAYVIIGLLYGESDFKKTIDISTRCGQDSDCNPATAAGILGTIVGYDNIPEYWKESLYEVENIKFKYTDYSLNDLYEISYKHAIDMLKKNNHAINDSSVIIKREPIETLPLEISFNSHHPVKRINVSKTLTESNRSHKIEFEGNAFVIRGFANAASREHPKRDITLILKVDDLEPEKINLPTDPALRRHEIAWKYELDEGKHSVKLDLEFLEKGDNLWLGDILIYSKDAQ